MLVYIKIQAGMFSHLRFFYLFYKIIFELKWIRHALESFDLGVYVFNDNQLSVQTLVMVFFAASKRVTC
jgi:hypothetical protein